MNTIVSAIAPSLLLAVALGGCTKQEQSIDQERGTPTPTPAASSAQPAPVPEVKPSAAPGFDISRVAVVSPSLGAFPYFSLIDGYRSATYKTRIGSVNGNKSVSFDRYEFFDGTKIIPVEGRLATIEAEGEGASALEVLRTYESLVTRLGGVKVFEGTAVKMEQLGLAFAEVRHREPAWDEDQMGIYLLRMPEKEIWVEAYVSSFNLKQGRYYLTVVERKALDVKASLLAAEEMKRELDTKGHVALYINFDFNKADIKPESQPTVDEIAKLLSSNPDLSLAVEGHTDNVGSAEYNRQLSEARARSVAGALAARGIESRRLMAAGYGPDKPIADNSAEDGRAKNRRVELVKMRG